jgi:hypothetical protein
VLALSRPDLRFLAQTSSPGSDLLRVLDHGYLVVAQVPRYGQWGDELLIFRVRDQQAGAPVPPIMVVCASEPPSTSGQDSKKGEEAA